MARWFSVAPCLAALVLAPAGPAAPQAVLAPPASPTAAPDLRRSACPESRHPVQVSDPGLTGAWKAAAAFDRAGHGFSPLPTAGNVIFEHHPERGTAAIHTCQLSDRVYRTIHFRINRGEARWAGEQQSFRSGRTFEDRDAGTVLEELILDYEIEPVSGFPLNRLNILYRGPATDGAGPSASPSLEEARLLLRQWGF